MDLFTLSASLGLDITNFEGGIGTARRLLLKFAGEVVDFGRDVIKTGMGFDKQMSAVQAVMGLTENTAENLATMNKLREFALEQARDSIFTSEETATAYYYMGMAGWRAEQMVAGLPGVMALAAASGEDLKMTSDMVTDSLTAFGYGADQATHFADVLAVTATNANTDVARMQQTFKNLAPIAGALGYSIEDVAVSVGLIANAGIKGSQAGTALRNIFTRIATNAGATSNTLGALSIITDKLGVSFYDAEGKARDWGDVLTEVRAAWAGMDEETREGVIRDFDSTVKSSEEAKIALKEFATDVEEIQNIQSKLAKQKDGDVWDRYASQIGEIGRQYDDLLTKLGVPIPKRPEEYADALEQARIKLGLMSDQEQIYYGKQIGSLRGISGWLALMTASEDDVKQLTEAIENADGAAQAMADTRLDNLWGDVVKFGAALDVLKIAIYDDVKGPMREVVQYGTAALNRITQAINEHGLTGGIEQLGIEIESLGEKFAPMLESLGTSLAPLVSSMFTSVIPSLGGAAIELGFSLGKGILQGIEDELGETVVSEMIGQVINGGGLGGVLKVAENALFGKNQKYTAADLGIEPERTSMGSMEAAIITMRVQTNAEDIQTAIDEADGAAELEINNVTMSTDQWQAVVDALTSDPLEFDADVDEEAISADITTATAGPYNVGLSADTSGVVSSIGTALSSRTFDINVKANVTGLPGTQKNARGMGSGYIFNRPTIFGYADGKYQMAGEAGPEAVVGVHSLSAMIQQSVAQAVKGIASAIAPARGNPAPMVMTLDGRVFARLQSSNTARADNARNKSIALGYGR